MAEAWGALVGWFSFGDAEYRLPRDNFAAFSFKERDELSCKPDSMD